MRNALILSFVAAGLCGAVAQEVTQKGLCNQSNAGSGNQLNCYIFNSPPPKDLIPSRPKDVESLPPPSHPLTLGPSTVPSASSPAISTLPPSGVRVDPTIAARERKRAALAVWSTKGLNSSTKKLMPIAIVAHAPSDRRFVQDLYVVLNGDFHLVDESEAALLIEVSGYSDRAQESSLSLSCTEPARSDEIQYPATANVTIRARWFDEKPLFFGQGLSNDAPGCRNDPTTEDRAKDGLLEKVKFFLERKAG